MHCSVKSHCIPLLSLPFSAREYTDRKNLLCFSCIKIRVLIASCVDAIWGRGLLLWHSSSYGSRVATNPCGCRGSQPLTPTPTPARVCRYAGVWCGGRTTTVSEQFVLPGEWGGRRVFRTLHSGVPTKPHSNKLLQWAGKVQQASLPQEGSSLISSIAASSFRPNTCSSTA